MSYACVCVCVRCVYTCIHISVCVRTCVTERGGGDDGCVCVCVWCLSVCGGVWEVFAHVHAYTHAFEYAEFLCICFYYKTGFITIFLYLFVESNK